LTHNTFSVYLKR